jgi:hypothetical protein
MRRASLPLLIMGGTADGASSADVPRLLRDTLGINFRLVLGYRDSAAIFLAMESGEVNGRMVELSSIRSTRPAWLKPHSDYHFLVHTAGSHAIRISRMCRPRANWRKQIQRAH